jgi:dTDP-4-amino-4,6-dideoxygalactose transaminase
MPVGGLGTVGCFSFYPSKNLGALGDGGAIVTHSAHISESIRRYGNIGTQTKYRHTTIGVNSRLDTIQAAILLLKLPHLHTWNQKRRRHADLYRNLLKGLPITLPQELPDRTTNYHLFVIRTNHRNALRKCLTKHGIETGIHYPLPLHLQPSLIHLGYKPGYFPISETAANTVLSLPMYPELTQRTIRYVTKAIHTFFQSTQTNTGS